MGPIGVAAHLLPFLPGHAVIPQAVRDGRVEALLIGPTDAVEAVIRECHQGPPAARVDGIERVSATDDGSIGFDQTPIV